MKWPKKLTCKVCGKSHSGVPFTCVRDCPDMYANLDRNESDFRAIIGSDQCVIDDECFFIRGILEIPIVGNNEPFLWCVWVSIDQDTFNEFSSILELKDKDKEREHSPFRGRLANALPLYSDTLNLRVLLFNQPLGMRPLIIVEEAHHVLAKQQKAGIAQGEAIEYATFLMHSAECQVGHT
jgi:hypothetical protein